MRRKPIKVYIAAGYSRKEEVTAIAKKFEDAGIIVTSRWHKEKAAPQISMNHCTESFLRRNAKKDIGELTEANHFVMLSVDPDHLFKRGGSCVENGFAIAKGFPIIVIGPRQHIFHYLPGIKRVDTAGQALEWLLREE